jgi:hypothetical protein
MLLSQASSHLKPWTNWSTNPKPKLQDISSKPAAAQLAKTFPAATYETWRLWSQNANIFTIGCSRRNDDHRVQIL